MHCCRKIDGNKFSMFLNFFDVISEFFRCFLSMFCRSILCLFYIFAFLCFVAPCFDIDPLKRTVSLIRSFEHQQFMHATGFLCLSVVHSIAFSSSIFRIGCKAHIIWVCSGRVLESRPRGCGLEPHQRHCVVVLEQDTFILA